VTVEASAQGLFHGRCFTWGGNQQQHGFRHAALICGTGTIYCVLCPACNPTRYTDQSGATSAGRTGAFNVHGVHSLQNDFILDGIDNNTFSENVQEFEHTSGHPSVETIQEFRSLRTPTPQSMGAVGGGRFRHNKKRQQPIS